MSGKLDDYAPLYEESWEYLDRNYPGVASMVQKLVAKGKAPEDIGREVVKRVGIYREQFGKRCELAAKYLEANSK